MPICCQGIATLRYNYLVAITFYTPEYFVFNNFSAHAVEFDGKLYPTAEHAYQASKCMNAKGKREIREARSPEQAKVLANNVYKAARDPEWDGGKKVIVMEQILRAKLAQHTEVADALRRSGTEKIIEDSPIDYFWGEGADGSGKNTLGELWMKIRSELYP